MFWNNFFSNCVYILFQNKCNLHQKSLFWYFVHGLLSKLYLIKTKRVYFVLICWQFLLRPYGGSSTPHSLWASP